MSTKLAPLKMRQPLECCLTREQLGEAVRRVWVECAREQKNPKPRYLVPWDDLDDANKEIDRRIGEAVAQIVCSNLSATEDQKSWANRLAKKIARRLFTNGASQRAKRLKLELENNYDGGGGWNETAAATQIEKVLLRAGA